MVQDKVVQDKVVRDKVVRDKVVRDKVVRDKARIQVAQQLNFSLRKVQRRGKGRRKLKGLHRAQVADKFNPTGIRLGAL